MTDSQKKNPVQEIYSENFTDILGKIFYPFFTCMLETNGAKYCVDVVAMLVKADCMSVTVSSPCCSASLNIACTRDENRSLAIMLSFWRNNSYSS